MKTFTIATLAILVSANVFAAETIYEGRGNIYTTNATLADLQSEATRLNTYTNGNSVAIKIHDGQIKDLQNTKVDKDVFTRDQIRQDEKLNEYGNRLDGYEASYADLSSTLGNYKASTDSRLAGLESDVQQAKAVSYTHLRAHET